MVDPACGSGHFVVAAARRIASALATVRTGESEPGPADLRSATADVIERCVYGVDLNDLAIEITKVALWLEVFDAERPLPFLDSHFRVGNALLGTTPALLRNNIPDTAFVVLGDDDRDWTAKLKARNKAEREPRAPSPACGRAPTHGANSKPTPTSSPPNASPTHGAPRSCSPRTTHPGPLGLCAVVPMRTRAVCQGHNSPRPVLPCGY